MFPVLFINIHSIINFIVILTLCLNNLSYSRYSELPVKLSVSELKQLQREFLDLMGLDKIPQLRKKSLNKIERLDSDVAVVSQLKGGLHIPKFIRDMYQMLEEVESEESEQEKLSKLESSNFRQLYNLSRVMERNVVEADVIITVKKTQLPIDSSGYYLNHLESSYFPILPLKNEGKFQQAEIRLFRENIERPLIRHLRICIFRLKHHPVRGISFHKYWICRLVSSYKTGWFEFDVTKWVKKWIKRPSKNVGIYITFTTMSGAYINPKHTGFILDANQQNSPLLVAFFESNKDPPIRINAKIRHKRSADTRDENYMWTTKGFPPRFDSYYNENYYLNQLKTNKSCLRRNFSVDFKDLGWDDWLIAPYKYEAYYCFGQCLLPLTSYKNATNHAVIQAMIHMYEPQKVALPCCVPTKLKSLKILYCPDNNEVILRKYNNMIVESCGCK